MSGCGEREREWDSVIVMRGTRGGIAVTRVLARRGMMGVRKGGVW